MRHAHQIVAVSLAVALAGLPVAAQGVTTGTTELSVTSPKSTTSITPDADGSEAVQLRRTVHNSATPATADALCACVEAIFLTGISAIASGMAIRDGPCRESPDTRTQTQENQ